MSWLCVCSNDVMGVLAAEEEEAARHALEFASEEATDALQREVFMHMHVILHLT